MCIRDSPDIESDKIHLRTSTQTLMKEQWNISWLKPDPISVPSSFSAQLSSVQFLWDLRKQSFFPSFFLSFFSPFSMAAKFNQRAIVVSFSGHQAGWLLALGAIGQSDKEPQSSCSSLQFKDTIISFRRAWSKVSGVQQKNGGLESISNLDTAAAAATSATYFQVWGYGS